MGKALERTLQLAKGSLSHSPKVTQFGMSSQHKEQPRSALHQSLPALFTLEEETILRDTAVAPSGN